MEFLKKIGRKLKKLKDTFVSWFQGLFGKYTAAAALATFLCFMAFISTEIAWALFSWTVVIAVYIIIFRVLWNLFETKSVPSLAS